MRSLSFLVTQIVISPIVILAFCLNNVQAHDVYKEPLQEKYNLKTVSCKTCHPNNKDRSIHNKFGKYFEEEFKDLAVTKGYEAAKEQGEEAQKKYEEVMVEQFKKALKVVEKKKLTFEDMIKAGLLNGTRLNEKKEPKKDESKDKKDSDTKTDDKDSDK